MQPHEAIVLDIEGTTTSISFVYDELFPFARAHVGQFLRANWADEQVQKDVGMIRDRSRLDAAEGVEGAVSLDDGAAADEVLGVITWLMDHDRKTTGLKSLQGKIWISGYESGELKGHIFEDIKPALERWAQAEIPVCIYSSGSVAAQKLLFAHTTGGDLRPLLSGYFDTMTGAKSDPESYTKIVAALNVKAERTLFATDKLSEAIAADAAGLDVVILDRPGNAPISESHAYLVAKSFENLD